MYSYQASLGILSSEFVGKENNKPLYLVRERSEGDLRLAKILFRLPSKWGQSSVVFSGSILTEILVSLHITRICLEILFDSVFSTCLLLS